MLKQKARLFRTSAVPSPRTICENVPGTSLIPPSSRYLGRSPSQPLLAVSPSFSTSSLSTFPFPLRAAFLACHSSCQRRYS